MQSFYGSSDLDTEDSSYSGSLPEAEAPQAFYGAPREARKASSEWFGTQYEGRGYRNPGNVGKVEQFWLAGA